MIEAGSSDVPTITPTAFNPIHYTASQHYVGSFPPFRSLACALGILGHGGQGVGQQFSGGMVYPLTQRLESRPSGSTAREPEAVLAALLVVDVTNEISKQTNVVEPCVGIHWLLLT